MNSYFPESELPDFNFLTSDAKVSQTTFSSELDELKWLNKIDGKKLLGNGQIVITLIDQYTPPKKC